MMIEQAKQPQGSKTRKLVFQMLVGGLFGLGGALGVSVLMESGVLGTLDKSQEIALLVAMLYAAIGLLVGFGAAVPTQGAHVLNVEDEGDLREQRRMLAWSALSMVVMGGLLALLALSAPTGPVSHRITLPIAVLAAVGLTWASVKMLREMDELMRALSRECGEMTYYLLLLVAGSWAVLAHLGLAAAMGMLDFITLNYALLLASSFIVSARRGMLQPR